MYPDLTGDLGLNPTANSDATAAKQDSTTVSLRDKTVDPVSIDSALLKDNINSVICLPDLSNIKFN